MVTVDVVICRVVDVHIKGEDLTHGILDIRERKPIARCGYFQYALIQETFDMVIPGMEGYSDPMEMNLGMVRALLS